MPALLKLNWFQVRMFSLGRLAFFLQSSQLFKTEVRICGKTIRPRHGYVFFFKPYSCGDLPLLYSGPGVLGVHISD